MAGQKITPVFVVLPDNICSQLEPSREQGLKCLQSTPETAQVGDLPDVHGNRQRLKKGIRKCKSIRKILENSGTNKQTNVRSDRMKKPARDPEEACGAC